MTKKEIAIQAIDRMYNDRSYSIEETKDNLKEIIEHCEVLIEAAGDE